jgi:hypothetical protein
MNTPSKNNPSNTSPPKTSGDLGGGPQPINTDKKTNQAEAKGTEKNAMSKKDIQDPVEGLAAFAVSQWSLVIGNQASASTPKQ